MTTANEILELALMLISEGISVIPLEPHGKRPAFELLPKGSDGKATWRPYQERIPTEEEARRWFTIPGHNLGIVCGAVSGNLYGIDFDNANLVQVWSSKYESLVATCPIVQSGREGGGYHIYARGTNATRCFEHTGGDIKGEGGYLVAPGSIHPSGKKYQLVYGDMAKVPTIDIELFGLEEVKPSGSAAKVQTPINGRKINEGEGRNNYLTKEAGKLRRIGANYEVIKAALLVENEGTCNPPLTESEIDTIAKSISKYEPADELLTLRRTDSGNADRFISLFGARLKYCDEQKTWLVWDGKRWARDAIQTVKRFGYLMIQGLYELGAKITEDSERGAFLKYVAGIDKLGKVDDAIRWAASDPAVAIRSSELDAHPMLLNVVNGTLELDSMTFRDSRQEDLLTKTTPVTFDPDAACPRWEIFLDEIFDGDEEMKRFIQQAVGYCLTGDTREQCLFILHGCGSNGKSTFVEIVARLLGDYATRTPVESLMVKRGESIPNDIARMKGARMVHSVETESGKRLAESMVKSLTGGDTAVARFLNKEWFEFKPEFKLMLATNHKPVIRGQDLAIWRRMRLVPFNVTFDNGRRDKDLARKLQEELPGILNWALAGCKDWLANGLSMPAAVKAATDAYRTDMDTLKEFFDERLEINSASEIPGKLLYATYLTYCQEANEKQVSRKAFDIQLIERGYVSQKTMAGKGLERAPNGLSRGQCMTHMTHLPYFWVALKINLHGKEPENAIMRHMRHGWRIWR